MPLRVHPEDASWEFRGAPQVDALRLAVRNPTSDYWTLDHLNPDYLVQNDGNQDDFHPVGDCTVMVRLRIDVTPNDHVVISKADHTTPGVDYEWEIYFDSSGNLVGRVSTDGTSWLSASVSFTYSGPHELLVAFTYDYSANTVVAYVVDSGGVLSNSGVGGGVDVELNDSGENVRIGSRNDLSGTEWPDRIYWWGYVDEVLTGTNLQDIFDNQDTHPMDFDLKCFDDFSDTVGAAHITLVGGYTFTVTGSPTHTGNQVASWPDPTRTFEPARHTGDFTVVGAFIPDNTGLPVDQGIVGKWNENGVNQRVWQIKQVQAAVKFAVSKDGTTAGTTEVTVPAVLTNGEISRFSMRYEDKGDGSSDLICEVDGTVVSSSTAVAPVFKSNAADIQVGDFDATVAKSLDGKMLWWGYLNRKLSDTEKTNLLSYFVRPTQIAGFEFYDDFHEAVGSTKDSTFPEFDVYNPYSWKGPMVFDVDGTPIQTGATESSWDGYRTGPGSLPLEYLDPIVVGVRSAPPERVYPRVSQKLLSTQATIPDSGEMSERVFSLSQQTERIYPRVSKKDLGPRVSPLRIKPRAGG